MSTQDKTPIAPTADDPFASIPYPRCIHQWDAPESCPMCGHMYANRCADAALALAREQREEIAELKRQKDGAYTERNALVCALSKLLPAHMEIHPFSEEWDDDWRSIVFVEGPTGQMTWHIHDSEVGSFNHLLPIEQHSWDGHTTEEKYERLAALLSKGGA